MFAYLYLVTGNLVTENLVAIILKQKNTRQWRVFSYLAMALNAELILLLAKPRTVSHLETLADHCCSRCARCDTSYPQGTESHSDG